VSTPSDPPPDRPDSRGAQPPGDPFELWRQIYAANERAWNAALERSMATPAFADAQGKLLETFLNVQKTFREQVRTYLEAVNVPSREDIARLGELIVGLEEKVDQLVDRVLDLETVVQRLPRAVERAAERERPATNARQRERPATSAPPLPASASGQPADGTARRRTRRSSSGPRSRSRRET
jgi:hypothetical protein